MTWRHEHENQIRKKSSSKASHRLSKMFMEARNARRRPQSIVERLWNNLLTHLRAASYHTKRGQEKKNRAFERVGVCTHVAPLVCTSMPFTWYVH